MAANVLHAAFIAERWSAPLAIISLYLRANAVSDLVDRVGGVCGVGRGDAEDVAAAVE